MCQKIAPDVFWCAHNPDFNFSLVILFFTTRVILIFYHLTFMVFEFVVLEAIDRPSKTIIIRINAIYLWSVDFTVN